MPWVAPTLPEPKPTSTRPVVEDRRPQGRTGLVVHSPEMT